MSETSAYPELIAIGALLAVALGVSWLGHKTRLPRVSLLLLLGVGIGPLGIDILPGNREQWFPVVSRIALVMVGFLIGGEFTGDRLRRQGWSLAAITAGQGIATASIVAGGLLLAGVDPVVALLLGGVATATDPAATRAVIEEEGEVGEAGRTVLGVVGLDDVIGIVTFSVLLATAGVAVDSGGGVASELLQGGRELGGGVLVGAAIGLPASQLFGRLRSGEPVLEEVLAAVLLCAGLTWWLDVSYLIAAVVMGAIVANLATHDDRPFSAVDDIKWPFLIVFFVLAGAQIDDQVTTIVWLLAGFVVLRTVGKVGGAALSARAVGIAWRRGRWFGVALLPQAGVALGMALAAVERYPNQAGDIIDVAVASTVIFELFGPLGVRFAVPRIEAD